MKRNIVTITDVMRVTDLSRPGVHQHIQRGNLEAEQINGYLWLITPEALAKFMQARAEGKHIRKLKREVANAS